MIMEKIEEFLINFFGFKTKLEFAFNLNKALIKEKEELKESFDYQIEELQEDIDNLNLLIDIPDERETYYTEKWKHSPITYKAQYGLLRDVRTFLPKDSCILMEKVKRNNLDLGTDDEKVLKILKYVHKVIKYTGDNSTHNVNEFWQHPEETIQSGKGDCIANYEEIYTDEGIKSVGELDVGDKVLSYDFNKEQYCYKPITKIWEKGKLPIKRAHLRNGQHIDITDNHPLWVRINQQGKSKYEKRYLKDINLSRWWNRKLPIAKKIPYIIKDISWLNKELCFALGHFLAEGHTDKSHVNSCGYELIHYIIPILEKNNIPFSESKNNSGVPTINFLKSDFKEFLKKQLDNSFYIHLEKELFHLPKHKLKAILDGFWLGDGHNGNYPDKRGYESNKAECYSTSSEQLAKDIQRIGLQIGRTFHIWKQMNHQGFGKKPIYRITYNPKSHFLKNFGYKDISEVSISYIEDLGKTKMRDFEVKDTHTFVFKNGIISHQCEDGSLLIKALCNLAGVPDYKIKVCAGWVEYGSGTCGHAYCIYLRDNDTWCVLDGCYYYTTTAISNRIEHKEDTKYNPKPGSIWWTFTQKYSYAQRDTAVLGRVNQDEPCAFKLKTGKCGLDWKKECSTKNCKRYISLRDA